MIAQGRDYWLWYILDKKEHKKRCTVIGEMIASRNEHDAIMAESDMNGLKMYWLQKTECQLANVLDKDTIKIILIKTSK